MAETATLPPVTDFVTWARRLAGDTRRLGRDTWRMRYLGWRLFRRDLAAEFSRARGGWLWNFADPLVLALVFVFLREGGPIGPIGLNIPYPVWVVIGMLSLQAFLNALNKPLQMVKQSRSLRAQVPVAPAALLLAQALRRGFDALFFLPVMGAVLLWAGTWSVTGSAVALLLYAVVVMAGLALGLALVPLNAVFEDVGKAVQSLNRPLLFLCPTFWYVAPGSNALGTLSAWNPLAQLMNAMRLAAAGVTPPLEALSVAAGPAAGAVALFAVAALVFHRVLPVLNARAD